MNTIGNTPGLTIVVPLFNEEENVVPMADRLVDVLRATGRQFEIIFVDDGSTDQTRLHLARLTAQIPELRILPFRRNFGQTAAMKAGFQHARGSIIVTLDGDMQNDPADIPMLLDKMEEGYDLVIGWRQNRQDGFLLRTFPSRIANWLIGRITGVPVHDSGCSLKAYRANMIRRIPLYSEMHRFIPAVSRTAGARIAEVVVRHHPRTRGKSKYGLSRVGKVLLDVVAIKMLIAFSRRPRIWFFLGAAACFGLASVSGLSYLMFLILQLPLKSSVVPQTLLILFGYLTLHFIAMGFLAEIVVKSSQIRPIASTVDHAEAAS